MIFLCHRPFWHTVVNAVKICSVLVVIRGKSYAFSLYLLSGFMFTVRIMLHSGFGHGSELQFTDTLGLRLGRGLGLGVELGLGTG